MITVCSQCHQEFPITVDLIGSKVECPVCENKWIVQDLSIVYPPLDDIPDYTVVDIETTGLSHEKDRIIEIAAQKVRNHQVIDSFETLIFPGCSVPQVVTQITGIRTSMLKDAPLWHEIAGQLAEFLDGEILVGHNIKEFDSQFLNDGFSRVMKVTPQFELIDTLDMARDLLPNLENHKLDTLTTAFNVQTSHHRAMVDVDSTRVVFEHLMNKASETKTDLYDYFFFPVMKTYKTTFDETNPLYGKNIVLTGEFEQLAREDAIVIIENMGGHCQNSVSLKTDILIICDNESNSSKMQKAIQLKSKGHDIKGMHGDDFIKLYAKQNGGKLFVPPISRRTKMQEKQMFDKSKPNFFRMIYRASST